MNHKRKRPKDRRAGCLSCKPHKSNGSKGSAKNQTIQERKAVEAMDEALREMVESGKVGA